MPVPHYSENYSFVLTFETQKSQSSNFVFKIVLALWELLASTTNFRMNLSIFQNKKNGGIFIVIALNLYINLDSIAILTILYLIIHKQNLFDLFKSVTYFNKVCSFCVQYYTCLNLFLSILFFNMLLYMEMFS